VSPLTLILVALALSMDAFAIAVASGIAIRHLRLHHALKIAFAFGLFQALMPVIGGFTGIGLRQYISTYDHWVIFVILTALGIKMIYESFKIKEVEEEKDPLNSSVLLILAIATSLDALAVGVTMGLGHMAIMLPSVIIGVITFGVTLSGVYIGRHSRHVNERVMEVVAGLALIGIGAKILIQHLME
jgi:putative Mn2+ efflux pump MntP